MRPTKSIDQVNDEVLSTSYVPFGVSEVHYKYTTKNPDFHQGLSENGKWKQIILALGDTSLILPYQ